MDTVNWCLMALAFALGLVLTLAYVIRRVKREVPVYADSNVTAATIAAPAAGGAAAKLVEPSGDSGDDEAPYGAGSARVAAGAAAPSGWLVKGNEDSMLYHTPESPTYERTIAELWFRDEDTARDAGFNRWDSGKSQRDKG